MASLAKRRWRMTSRNESSDSSIACSRRIARRSSGGDVHFALGLRIAQVGEQLELEVLVAFVERRQPLRAERPVGPLELVDPVEWDVDARRRGADVGRLGQRFEERRPPPAVARRGQFRLGRGHRRGRRTGRQRLLPRGGEAPVVVALEISRVGRDAGGLDGLADLARFGERGEKSRNPLGARQGFDGHGEFPSSAATRKRKRAALPDRP